MRCLKQHQAHDQDGDGYEKQKEDDNDDKDSGDHKDGNNDEDGGFVITIGIRWITSSVSTRRLVSTGYF